MKRYLLSISVLLAAAVAGCVAYQDVEQPVEGPDPLTPAPYNSNARPTAMPVPAPSTYTPAGAADAGATASPLPPSVTPGLPQTPGIAGVAPSTLGPVDPFGGGIYLPPPPGEPVPFSPDNTPPQPDTTAAPDNIPSADYTPVPVPIYPVEPAPAYISPPIIIQPPQVIVEPEVYPEYYPVPIPVPIYPRDSDNRRPRPVNNRGSNGGVSGGIITSGNILHPPALTERPGVSAPLQIVPVRPLPPAGAGNVILPVPPQNRVTGPTAAPLPSPTLGNSSGPNISRRGPRPGDGPVLLPQSPGNMQHPLQSLTPPVPAVTVPKPPPTIVTPPHPLVIPTPPHPVTPSPAPVASPAIVVPKPVPHVAAPVPAPVPAPAPIHIAPPPPPPPAPVHIAPPPPPPAPVAVPAPAPVHIAPPPPPPPIAPPPAPIQGRGATADDPASKIVGPRGR